MFKKVFILSSGNIFNIFISGLLGIYIARILGPEDKGVLTIILTSCGLLSMIFSAGIPYSAAYYIRSKPNSKHIILSQMTKMMVINGILLFVLVILSKDVFASIFLGGRKIDAVMTALLILIVVISFAKNTLGATLISQGDSKSFVWISNTGTLINVVIIILFIRILPQKLYVVLLGNLIGMAVATIIMLQRYGFFKKRPDVPPADLPMRQFYAYGIKAQVGAVATFLFKRMDIYIIGYFLNTSAVGLYSIGLGLRDLAITIPSAMAGLAGGDMADPKIQANGKAKTILKKGVIFNIFCSIAILLGSILILPYFIPLAYGKAFTGSIIPSIIIMGSLLPFSISLLIGKAIHAKGKPLNSSISNIISAIISVVIVWQLTKRYNIIGAAVATIIDGIILVIMGWIFLRLSGNWHSKTVETNKHDGKE